jgi:hypothetical protein
MSIGYESWFVSARDPISPRALWIRRTRHRPVQGPESVALWCAVFNGDRGRPPGELSLSSDRGAYEYATRQEMPGIIPQQLPEG